MKKITLLSASLLLFLSANAEQMQFVTTRSAPVGNFAHLDAADSTHVTSAPILNFCNTRSNVGNIVIKGANAYIKQINMQSGTSLGSTNTPEYRLSEKMTVENGGTVTAGRLMADKVTFEDANYHKSNVTNTLYGSDITVKGGKTDNMEISSTAKINKSAQNAANLGQNMEWSNQYKCDYHASANTVGKSEWGTEYVDIKEYIRTGSSYVDGKGAPWYTAGDDSREYDVQCDCGACFDDGSTMERDKESWKMYFTEICSEHSVNGDMSNARALASWVSAQIDPSYYEQAGFNIGNQFYKDSYILGGAYGSNGHTWLVNKSSACTAQAGDVGPYPLAQRSKSYAVGCLVPALREKGKYTYNYCVFWNCRVKEPGTETEEECKTPKYTSYLLKSK